MKNELICLVELITYAPIAASEMPSVVHAGKLAAFGECVNSPIAISHSHRSTREPSLCFPYEPEVNVPSTYTKM
ncbi:unnamed protein product [Echinostoma caproni]|uniref:Secreted protein n=1 Tax=Echinostoma caproni TaxID=27848 RepID=A0A183A4L6_9TREM|nr:unnamed protein product [Echinostoma caproni]